MNESLKAPQISRLLYQCYLPKRIKGLKPIRIFIYTSNMKFIRKIKGAKNAAVNLVEIEGKLWVHKKEDEESTENEKAFYVELRKNGLPALKILELEDLPKDEIIVEYVKDSPPVGETTEEYYQWGGLLRKLHDIRYDSPTKLHNGSLVELDLKEEYKRELYIAKARMIERPEFTESDAEQVVTKLLEGLAKVELEYSLIHGDMHSANVLKKDNELYLFDKSSSQWSFTPLLDLAIVMLGVPNGLVVETDDSDYKLDDKLRGAFLKGYGSVNLQEVKLFTQLEASRRVNNSHEPMNPGIVKALLQE